jgi:hypothetical protein
MECFLGSIAIFVALIYFELKRHRPYRGERSRPEPYEIKEDVKEVERYHDER